MIKVKVKVNNMKIKTSLSKPTLRNMKEVSNSTTSFIYESNLKRKVMNEIFNDRSISEVMKKLAKI